MAIRIKAYQFAVNNVGDREAIIVANPNCYLVEIKELPSISPKQLFRISDVPTGGEYAEVNAGTPHFFSAPTYRYPGGGSFFEVGEIVGYVESATGATTFQRLEHLV